MSFSTIDMDTSLAVRGVNGLHGYGDGEDQLTLAVPASASSSRRSSTPAEWHENLHCSDGQFSGVEDVDEDLSDQEQKIWPESVGTGREVVSCSLPVCDTQPALERDTVGLGIKMREPLVAGHIFGGASPEGPTCGLGLLHRLVQTSAAQPPSASPASSASSSRSSSLSYSISTFSSTYESPQTPRLGSTAWMDDPLPVTDHQTGCHGGGSPSASVWDTWISDDGAEEMKSSPPAGGEEWAVMDDKWSVAYWTEAFHGRYEESREEV